MRYDQHGPTLRACALTLALLTLPAMGCIGALAQGLYLFHGEKVPAEFGGLEGKRVAVICLSNTASAGPGSDADVVARLVSTLLAREVKEIQVVHLDEVYDWMDNNNWDQTDYRQVGRGVKADMVVAIEVTGLRLYEGSTLFKGRASINTIVIDMSQNGQVVFRRETPDFAFPSTAGHHTADTSEAKFRRIFQREIATHVARHFFSYDLVETFGSDAAMGGL
ncbi:MAG: hypothetical protein J5I93_04275 [Pirellulaceae bacterium]|nr:hypothetical protein [Pirellulaceae bacterium]